MYKTVLLLLSVCFFLLYADISKAQGWRSGEMEIKIQLKNASDAATIQALKLNGDIYHEYAFLYVVPAELERIEETGLEYTISKRNLNQYYRGYWQRNETYHSYQEIIDLMDSLAGAFPDICKKVLIGRSVQNRELSYLKISDNAEVDEFEAEILFDGGIHGDEIGAAENCIRFARMLCLEYANDPNITSLVNNREIFIYPMVNPDGRENMTRYNANGVDLNRDFGYMWDAWGNSPSAFSQVESKKLRNLFLDNQFSISLSLHSGTEIFIYPWYYRQNQCPDHNAMHYLAAQYVNTSGYQNLLYGPGATTLYEVNGSSAETVYGNMGTYGMVIEISSNKQPPTSQIMHYYNLNEASMIDLIENAGYGIKGVISDTNGNAVVAAIRIDNQLPVYSDPLLGDYHKFLEPGNYSLQVKANGYRDTTIQNINIQDHSSSVIRNITLQTDSGQYVYRIIACQIPDNNYADEGASWEAIGKPDSINYSIGKNGWVILDVQTPVINGEGTDFIVYEGDQDAENYNCHVSLGMDGPWFDLGQGSGTTEFDLSDVIINNARYIRLQDDGNGSSGSDAGFDLDAIEVIRHPPGIFLALSEYSVIDTAGGNANHHIDPGETVDILVGLYNTGDNTAQNVQGSIEADPQYTSINTNNINFGNIPSGDTAYGIFNISMSSSTPQGYQLLLTLNVTSNGGTYQNSYELVFTVGKIQVLIIDLDPNKSSGPVIAETCEQLGVTYEYRTAIPVNFDFYKSAFLCLGIFQHNHVLTQAEGQKLAAFLDNKGDLYMEGGDTWYFDASTPLHPYFNIQGLSDGDGDLDTLRGMPGFITDGMEFNYSGENSFIDRIKPINYAVRLFDNSDPVYTSAVAFEGGTYQTVGTSFEFGGLEDGDSPSTKIQWLKNILNFFDGVYTNIELPYNTKDFHCIVYPNPCKKDFYIIFDAPMHKHISIDVYNIKGRKIYSKNVRNTPDGNNHIKINDIFAGEKSNQAGMYFISLKVNHKNTIIKKLIKVN
ncbi:MAG: succinylglutamate desuccinylase/aspartoacylase family protein [Bacteroidales bacterium]|nr:succinylglutamate desuccinylase/aspartoacylase family protein [Bacteroidales bacterium]MCF8387722.1 succinylglutamate desuccinylase/aspartoacylase family protein [Bacteroidales bacterium]MCF8397064.1 succinylglutamate desuccinylase/aspartoacylase family protein [Bacteroidales bacterium]